MLTAYSRSSLLVSSQGGRPLRRKMPTHVKLLDQKEKNFDSNFLVLRSFCVREALKRQQNSLMPLEVGTRRGVFLCKIPTFARSLHKSEQLPRHAEDSLPHFVHSVDSEHR